MRQLERAPDHPALGFMDPDGTVVWRTRAEFQSAAAGHGVRLQELGLATGDVCVIVLPSQELAARLVLAVLLAGAVPLLVAPPLLQGANSSLLRVLQHTTGKTRARLVVCDSSLRELEPQLRVANPATRYVFADELSDAADGSTGDFAPAIPKSAAIAALQLTSGTTGFPKVCVWNHAGVLAALDAMARAMKLGAGDRCFNWTPLYHDMGLVNNFFLCLMHGVPLAMLNPHEFVRRPALWLRGLSETGATHTWSPNFGFALAASRIRDAEVDAVRLDHVRAFWNAAERIHLETLEDFHRRFQRLGLRREALKTNFGCAENVGGATFSDPHGAFVYERIDRAAFHDRRVAVPVDEAKNGRGGVTVVGVGRPAPGLEIVILSRTGKPLADAQIGEIGLRTPSRMLGYLRDTRATRRAIRGDLLRTGDLGYTRGGELFWVGRNRERINIAGKKLDPSDFERILLEVPELRPGCFAAFGVDDRERGTQQVVIVSEVSDHDVDADRIIGEIRNNVSLGLGVPADDVVLVAKGTLAKTSSGKRRHRHFRQLYMRGELARYSIGAGPLAHVAAGTDGRPADSG